MKREQKDGDSIVYNVNNVDNGMYNG